jgi:threonine synthase
MILSSTNDHSVTAGFVEAVRRGLAPDGGLYLPTSFARFPEGYFDEPAARPFTETAFTTLRLLLGDEVTNVRLTAMIDGAFSFPVPVRSLDEQTSVLELFHGPTLAFKDFGARFMAQVLAGVPREDDRPLLVLVATSGDTGGAVASGFSGVVGTRVVLLYPAGRVSPVQELQLITAGENVTAIRVKGSFDDCQRLAKAAFADRDVMAAWRLTSANSINIARLLAQVVYFVHAWGELGEDRRGVVFAVPSGNFGNLTAGLIAREMGLPVHRFLAATNINDTVPEYLRTGVFRPREALPTISNAMDVGNPSNLARIRAMFGDDVEALRQVVTGETLNDDETRTAIAEAHSRLGYLFDPHGAVAYGASRKFLQDHRSRERIVVLGTAHPAKFPEAYGPAIRATIDTPPALRALADRPRHLVEAGPEFTEIKTILTSLL